MTADRPSVTADDDAPEANAVRQMPASDGGLTDDRPEADAAGRRAVHEAIEEAPPVDGAGDVPGLGGGCPVAALGHRDGVYYFLSPSGEVRDKRPSELGRELDILDVFAGQSHWLAERWPKKNDAGEIVGWNVRQAGRGLMRACVSEGLWDPNTPLRGPGVWRGDDGGLICHCGDVLILIDVDGGRDVIQAGQLLDDVVYPAAPCIKRPAVVPAPADVGHKLLATLGLWHFESMIGAELVLG